MTVDYSGADFYCDVAIPRRQDLDVVFEDPQVLAYHHTRPYWPTHVVVVPKRHLASFTTVGPDDEQDLRALLAAVQRVARQVESAEGAAAVLTNLGRYQDSKHLHVHVYAGEPLRRPRAVESGTTTEGGPAGGRGPGLETEEPGPLA